MAVLTSTYLPFSPQCVRPADYCCFRRRAVVRPLLFALVWFSLSGLNFRRLYGGNVPYAQVLDFTPLEALSGPGPPDPDVAQLHVT